MYLSNFFLSDFHVFVLESVRWQIVCDNLLIIGFILCVIFLISLCCKYRSIFKRSRNQNEESIPIHRHHDLIFDAHFQKAIMEAEYQKKIFHKDYVINNLRKKLHEEQEKLKSLLICFNAIFEIQQLLIEVWNQNFQEQNQRKMLEKEIQDIHKNNEHFKQITMEAEFQKKICDKDHIMFNLRKELRGEQEKLKFLEIHYQQILKKEKLQQKIIEDWKQKFHKEQKQRKILEKKIQDSQEKNKPVTKIVNKSVGVKENGFKGLEIHSNKLTRHLFPDALKDNLITKWDPMPFNQTFMKVVIPEHTEEFVFVKKIFNNNKKIVVTKVERVQNVYTLGCYMLKKLEMEKVHGIENVKQVNLFHGTKASNVDSICENNFNWRKYGENIGNKYGRGVSFTPFPSYASHYSDKSSVKVMFLVKVLISKVTVGNENMEIPPTIDFIEDKRKIRFDTTVNKDLSVVVKYNDNEFYPQYLIYYSTKKS